MNDPHDLNRTIGIPASEPTDSLDAGLAAGFRRSIVPRSSLGDQRRVLLREAEGESDLIIKPTSDAMPPRELSGDRYQLEGEIARGGMGVVLRGRDVDLGRDLAVKVLLEKHRNRPDVARRFVEEAQIGGQLQHPGIVPVYDIGRFGDLPFFAMKLVKGQTLATLLEGRTDPAHDLPRFLAIALQVFQTMAYAHAKGVIHRDLKPANIMVGAFGEVQVMDWGLAKVLQEGGIADEERASRLHRQAKDVTTIRTLRSGSSHGTGSDTEAGSLLGTPAYMPPEQANGDVALLDRRCDVFGLGSILCEILTGKPPYVGRNGEEVRRHAANANLVDANARLDACGADADLVALTKKCLAPEPLDRPKDAQAVADILAAHLNGVQERLQEAQRESAVAQARAIEERKRRRVQLALAGAVLSLLLGGGAVAWWRNEQVQADRERKVRNAEALAALLGQGEEALRKNDTARATVVLEAAQKRSTEGGVDDQVARLQSLRNDLALLKELDAVDQFRWSRVGNKMPSMDDVVERVRQTLDRFGLDPGTFPVDRAAAQVAVSAVRDRILAGLDLLLRQQKSKAVRSLLQRVDADSFRDLIRDAVLADDQPRMRELAEREAALEQPPGFAAFMGNSTTVPIERRRQLLKYALRNSPGNLTLLMDLGDSYSINQKDGADEKLRWYQAAVAASPENPAAHTSLGFSLLDKNQIDQAINSFRKAVSLAPSYALYHSNLGMALSDKGETEKGMECYKMAIEIDPKCAMAHNNLGVTLHNQGHLDQAMECYKKAIQFDPKLAVAHSNLGNLLKNGCQLDRTLECYKRAIELDPKFVQAHNNLGLALQERGQLDQAIEYYKKAIKIDPSFFRAHANLGAALHAKGQLDQAIESSKNAIQLNPRSALAHFNLGSTLLSKGGREDEAIDCYKKAIEIDPKYALAHRYLGIALKNKGQLDDAIDCFKKAIEIDPKIAVAHINLGNALKDKDQVNQAIESYKKAIELEPNNAPAHNNLGILLQEKGQLDQAMECYKKAIEVDSKYAPAHGSLGKLLQKRGQADQAIESYRMAIELDPKLAGAHNNLGTALKDKGQVDQAIECYKKAIELDPKLAMAHTNLGSALTDKGRVDEAIPSFNKAIELKPKDSLALSGLGRAKRLAAARDRFPAYRDGRYTPATTEERIGLAEWCQLKGFPRAAAGLYAAAFAADPRVADNMQASHRYNAACFSALAATGMGEDSASLDGTERKRLRKQALDWLKADLALYSKQLETATPTARAPIQGMLRHWQEDTDLVGIRDAAALAKLPGEEQKAFTQLWADVAALLKKAQEKPQ